MTKFYLASSDNSVSLAFVRTTRLIAFTAACLSGCSSDGTTAVGQTGGSTAQGGGTSNNAVGGKSSTAVGGTTNQGGSGNATGGVTSTGSTGGSGTTTPGGTSTGGSGTAPQAGASATGGVSATGGTPATGGSNAGTGGAACATTLTVTPGLAKTASGLAVVSVPLTGVAVGSTIPGQRVNYENVSSLASSYDLSCSTLNFLAYAPGVTSGDIRVFFTSLGSFDSPAVNIPLSSLAGGFTTVSVPVPPASGSYDPVVLFIIRLEFEADPNFGTTFQPTTVVYIDRIWTSNGRFNDTFDTDFTASQVILATSGARPLPGTTVGWMSQYSPPAGTGGASNTGGSSATATGGSVSGSGGTSSVTGGSTSSTTGGSTSSTTGGNTTASGGGT